jgi:hypothetical protein
MKHLVPLLLLAACASAPKEASWLFVQNAERAELAGGKLTLTGLDPHIVCFTDRPQRRAGTVPTPRFLDGWGKGGVFAGDPPNATLAIFGDGEVEEAVVVLRNPRLSGDTLTYEVTVLEGAAARAGPAALFIDNLGDGAPVIRHGMHDEPGVVIRRGMHPVR